MLPLVVLFPSFTCTQCGKRRRGLCGPAAHVRHVKGSVCQRLCAAVWAEGRDGRGVPASWEGCHASCAVHNQNTSVLRAPILLQTWGEALCCWCIRSSCRVQWDWGVQEIHTHSPDFQLLVSGQHSGIKLELLPYDKQAPDTLKKCRQRAASFTHLLL